MVFILDIRWTHWCCTKSGSFESGLLALTKTKGHEFLLVFMVSVLMVLGGTLCGIEEEGSIYPILYLSLSPWDMTQLSVLGQSS